MSKSVKKRIVVSVNLPAGMYQELQKLLETEDYIHMSDLIRAALRFYIDYKRRQKTEKRDIVIG